MTEIGFFLGIVQEVVFREHTEHPGNGYIDDIQFTKQVFLVLIVDISLADENMVEGLFNQHMKDVVVLMFEKQVNESAKETYFTDLAEDLVAGNRNAVTEQLEQSVVIKVYLYD